MSAAAEGSFDVGTCTKPTIIKSCNKRRALCILTCSCDDRMGWWCGFVDFVGCKDIKETKAGYLGFFEIQLLRILARLFWWPSVCISGEFRSSPQHTAEDSLGNLFEVIGVDIKHSDGSTRIFGALCPK
ncbi:MAG: hypothetical protein CL912_13225 [Deltaproteobacteria bacterium]|nr:hypothetical protein [Deltaproteobacteria bacterium]